MIEFNLNLTGSILDWVNFVRFKTFLEWSRVSLVSCSNKFIFVCTD